MKNYLMLGVIVFIFVSCSKETAPPVMNLSVDEIEVEGTWKLEETSGQIPDSRQTGADMPFQEIYQFHSDGSFIKTRNKAGETVSAHGFYEWEETETQEEEGQLNLTLSYPNDNPIIANCTQDLNEYLFIRDQRLHSTWNACDGLGLIYKKID